MNIFAKLLIFYVLYSKSTLIGNCSVARERANLLCDENNKNDRTTLLFCCFAERHWMLCDCTISCNCLPRTKYEYKKQQLKPVGMLSKFCIFLYVKKLIKQQGLIK